MLQQAQRRMATSILCVLASVIVAAWVTPDVIGTNVARAAARPAGLRARAQLDATRELTNLLLQADVVVQDIRPTSSLTTLFPDSKEVVFVLTNLGGIDLAVLRGERAAEGIAVLYRKSSDRRLLHRYEFQTPDGRTIGTTDIEGPLYFTFHENWFIQTLSARLDAIIKLGLGQATLLNR